MGMLNVRSSYLLEGQDSQKLCLICSLHGCFVQARSSLEKELSEEEIMTLVGEFKIISHPIRDTMME